MTRADMRLKLLEQMVLDRDARIAELEALAVPQADYLALSEKCAKLGDLLREACGKKFIECNPEYRNAIRNARMDLAQ